MKRREFLSKGVRGAGLLGLAGFPAGLLGLPGAGAPVAAGAAGAREGLLVARAGLGQPESEGAELAVRVVVGHDGHGIGDLRHPAVDLADEDLHTLVVFTMGLNKPDIPLDFFSVETLNELKGRRRTLTGDETFAGLCSACHGKNAKGKSFTADYKWGVPALANQDFLAVASAGFMEMTIYNGRSGRQMAAWTPRFSRFRPGGLQVYYQREGHSVWPPATPLFRT